MIQIFNGIWNPEVQPFEIRTNGLHYGKNHWKWGQKCPDFEYSGDLNSKHMNNKLYLFVIQMVGSSDAWYHGTRHLNSQPVFKWWPEHWSGNQRVQIFLSLSLHMKVMKVRTYARQICTMKVRTYARQICTCLQFRLAKSSVFQWSRVFWYFLK